MKTQLRPLSYSNGVTTEYNYQNGNITSVTQNGTAVKTYGYTDSTWSDLLTNFNGQTITYDDIGNPLQYRDGMSFTWAKGRQLQGITKDGLNASYTYDENGLRISKTVNGVTTKIFRTNGQMVGMNMSDGKDMTFILDGDGNVYGVHYDHYSASGLRSETYYFAYNAQGDVIGIYDFSGRLMAAYDYDEWGNCTVNVLAADSNGHAIDSPDHIAHVNPFRYRGYFYDAETGFYYLNSRYYDPGTGRFVNADKVVSASGKSIHGYNTFAYCFNNPVNMSDQNGNWPKWVETAANWVKTNIIDPVKDAINSALSVQYDVPLYEQGNLPLCWAYSQTMVESFQNGTTLTQGEADSRAREIAVSVHGEDNWRQGGWPTNRGKRISTVNRISLAYELKKGPLYGYYANSDSAHLIVVTGIDVLNGTVFTNNPWGVSGQQSIEEFKNGFAGASNNQNMPLICLYRVDE